MSDASEIKKLKIGLVPAMSLIVANMVGTGVFTSLGFQALNTKSVFALLSLWLIGGLVALAGALTYGELATRFPRSGGEYNYLSSIYKPALGFLSGWVSATVGFAAPMAISAMAFGKYFLNVVPGLGQTQLAALLILSLTLINITSFRFGSTFQTAFTLLNITLIVSLTACGIFTADHSHFSITVQNSDWADITSPHFAVSLVYVSFAYSGWNSATYVAAEIRNPSVNLPKALFLGTFIVMLLYIGLNFVFLYSSPLNELAGQADVAFVAATHILGKEGGQVIACIIAIGLIASVNALMIAGPRVTQVMGEDFSLFRIMAVKNKKGSPVFATLLQSAIALILIFTSTFDQVLTYIGFTLALFTTLTVAGIFIVRARYGKAANTYTTWGYPLVPAFFILVEIGMMGYTLLDKPAESIAGCLTILSGLILFFILKTNVKKAAFKNENTI